MPKDYPAAFSRLREVLQKHASGMRVLADTPTDFTVVAQSIAPNGQPMWFGAVKLGKSAVTYHLMPLYYNPKLTAEIPDELRRRKQGKTCFNFQAPDDALFTTLDELTRTARAQWEERGLLRPGALSMETLNQAMRAAGGDPDALARVRKQKGKRAAAKRAATIRKKKNSR
jgi:hypothetical protein